MHVSTREAYSLFRKWRDEGRSLRFFGILGPKLSEALKGSVTIADVSEMEEKIRIADSADGWISLRGALFELAENSADASGKSDVLVADLPDGGKLIFGTSEF